MIRANSNRVLCLVIIKSQNMFGGGGGVVNHGKCNWLKLVLGSIFRMDHLLCD